MRDGHDFDDDDLETATLLMPMLIVLDRVHERRSAWSVPDSDTSPRADGGRLSTRKRQVVDLLGTGMTARAIGNVLGISPRTVSKHLEHAYQKLGMHDRLVVSNSVGAPAFRPIARLADTETPVAG